MFKTIGKTYVRLFDEKWTEQAMEWYYDQDNAMFFYDFGPMKKNDFAGFVNVQDGLVFTIHDANFDSGCPIGMVMVHDIKWKAKVASIGIMIENEYRGAGRSKKAVAIVAEFLVNEMGIEKLVFEAIAQNTRVCEMVSCETKVEATLFNEAVFQGKRVNVYRYSMFKDAVLKTIENIAKKK